MNGKMTLQDVEWKEFKIKDIFIIKDGYYNKKPPMTSNKGIPFLGATQFNNGITGFVEKEVILKYDKVGDISDKNINDRIFKGNCLAITNNGSVGNIFYQKVEFTCSHDITPIYLKSRELNENIAKFLIPLLKKSGESFEYAKKWRPKRMRKSRMLLPVDKKGNPNWGFMENYIKQEQKEITNKIVNYYQNKLDNILTTYTGGGILSKYNNIGWKVFEFNKIFREIKRGKRLTKSNQVIGDIPYVSSSSLDNGVDNFISNSKNIRKFKNTLSIANSGSVGSCFYHKYEYVASDHITNLKLGNADENIYLFMATIVKRLEEKYSFNREINDNRIQREKIILPVDKNENPNWEYMSNFIKNIEKEKVEKVLQYIYIYIVREFLENYKNKYLLNNIKWKEFKIKNIFTKLKRGDNKSIKIVGEGKIYPYIGAKYNDNGVTGFVNEENIKIFEGNAVVFVMTGEGSVGMALYKQEKFAPSNNVFVGYSNKLNKYNGQFIVSVINKNQNKYNYGYIRNENRLKNEKLMLPIDKNENPNWQYMDEYIKIQKAEKYIDIIKRFQS